MPPLLLPRASAAPADELRRRSACWIARMRLYRDYTKWYRLLDPPEDHREEADAFQSAFERVVSPRPETLLELGAGAGHNGLHLKRRFRCTLTDLSEEMLTLSRELNPECEHVACDMRTLDLRRTLDVVLVHDAIVYMTSEADLAAAVTVARWCRQVISWVSAATAGGGEVTVVPRTRTRPQGENAAPPKAVSVRAPWVSVVLGKPLGAE